MARHPVQPNVYSRALFEALPLPVFVVDHDMRIVDMNPAAAMVPGESEDALLWLCGGALRCKQCVGDPERCGEAEACKQCVIRNSVTTAYTERVVVREKTKMLVERSGGLLEIHLWVTTAPLTTDGRQLVVLMIEDITELVQLQGLLPICMHCRKVRDDEEYWQGIEDYLSEHTDLCFTHGICPDCMEQHYSHLR